MSEDDLLSALEEYVKVNGDRHFTTREFDKWPRRRCQARTIWRRFGTWKKALSIIGIEGGRQEHYTPEELIFNLETIWKQVGRPPGHRQMSKLGAKISYTPYRRVWGSVRKACEMVSKFHNGEITREQLLAGDPTIPKKSALRIGIRWQVLKRDNYRCVVCGASPAADHSVKLEVDHTVASCKGGSDDLVNLRTLCEKCNRGKSGE